MNATLNRTHDDVFAVGIYSQMKGLPQSANPYAKYNEKWDAWNRGWEVAAWLEQRAKEKAA